MKDHKSLIKLLNLISEVQDYEEAKMYLAESGHDVDEILAEGEEFLGSIKAQADLKFARKKRKLFKKAKKLLDENVHQNPKEELIRILSVLKPGLLVQFSKIEELHKKDAQEILNEEELLKLLNKLEEDEQRRE